jgi:hypothetical protein
MKSWMRKGRWLAAGVAGFGIACGDEGTEPEPRLEAAEPIEVSHGDQPPEIQHLSLEPAEPLAGDRMRAIVMARDPDGDRVEISYRWHVAGEPMAEEGSEIVLGEVSKGDWVEVEVIVTDGDWESEPEHARAEVRNQRPVMVGVRLDPAPSVAPGEKVVAIAVGQDEDGDEIEYRYEWRVNGRSVEEDGSSLDTASLDRGDEIQLLVTANDGESDSDPVESIVVQIGNASPEIVSDPSGFREDGVFAYTIEAGDPDGDRNLRYSLRAAPEGMSVDSILGAVTWRPTAEQAGKHTVEVVVTDSQGAWTLQRFELDVAVADEVGEVPAAPAP